MCKWQNHICIVDAWRDGTSRFIHTMQKSQYRQKNYLLQKAEECNNYTVITPAVVTFKPYKY